MEERRNFQKTDVSVTIDQMIQECGNCFELEDDYREEMQFKYIKEAFDYHYNNCKEYKNYCNVMKVGPADIQNPADYCKIPLIHSTLFKLTDVITCDKSEIARVCQSSGTKGTVSKIYRDQLSIDRFFSSIKIDLTQVLGIEKAYCINLGPSSEEAGDLWIAYAVGLLHNVYPTQNMVVNGEFSPQKVIDLYQSVRDEYPEVIIIGAPILVLTLIEYMEKNNITFENCENIHFITAGGWKRFTGQSIERDAFIERIQGSFKGTLSARVHDVFNMVELNSVFAECQYHKKHVVPWVRVQILNPEDLSLVKDGEPGLISYLDASAKSYPCFILTDDIGRIDTNGVCECGRRGQTVEIIRRVKSVDSRGCALKIDKKYASASK